MELQLRRALLEACVLAVLGGGDSYGYQLVKDVSNHIAITESTLYPILKRLESTELVRVYSVEHSGRLRRYYAITPKGLARISENARDWKEAREVIRFITAQQGGDAHE